MKWFIFLFVMTIIITRSFAGWTWGPDTLTQGQSYTNTMFIDYYSSVVERCEAIGTNIFAKPSFAQTFSIYSGTTQSITYVTNGLVVSTNINDYSVYTNIVFTNILGPMVFTNNSVVTTNIPVITRAMVAALDDLAESFATYFVQHWYATNGLFNSYLTSLRATNIEPTLPYGNMAAFFNRLNIGTVTNLQTNILGVITNGTAYFTRQPPTTQNLVLAEYYYSTNDSAWHTANIPDHLNSGDVYYGPGKPVLKFYSSGTNYGASISTTIEGWIFSGGILEFDFSTPITIESASTINVLVSNTAPVAVTNFFGIIDTLTFTSSGTLNHGDRIALVYTNEMVLYGDLPYVLYAEDLDERYKYLNALRWTWDDSPSATVIENTVPEPTITVASTSYEESPATGTNTCQNPTSSTTGSPIVQGATFTYGANVYLTNALIHNRYHLYYFIEDYEISEFDVSMTSPFEVGCPSFCCNGFSGQTYLYNLEQYSVSGGGSWKFPQTRTYSITGITTNYNCEANWYVKWVAQISASGTFTNTASAVFTNETTDIKHFYDNRLLYVRGSGGATGDICTCNPVLNIIHHALPVTNQLKSPIFSFNYNDIPFSEKMPITLYGNTNRVIKTNASVFSAEFEIFGSNRVSYADLTEIYNVSSNLTDTYFVETQVDTNEFIYAAYTGVGFSQDAKKQVPGARWDLDNEVFVFKWDIPGGFNYVTTNAP